MLQLMFGHQEFLQLFWLSWYPSPTPKLHHWDCQSLFVAQIRKWRRLGCLGLGSLFQRTILFRFSLKREGLEWLLTILTSVSLLAEIPSLVRQWRQYQLQVDIPRSTEQTLLFQSHRLTRIWLHTHLFRKLLVSPRCSDVCSGVRAQSVRLWAGSWESI